MIRESGDLNPKKQWTLSRYEAFLIPCMGLFTLGMALGNLFPKHLLLDLPIALSLITLLLGLIFWSPKRWTIQGSFWLIAFILGGLYFQTFSFHPPTDDISRFAPQPHARIIGVVLSQENTRGIGTLDVQSINGLKASGKLQFKTKTGKTPGGQFRHVSESWGDLSFSPPNKPPAALLPSKLPSTGSTVELEGNLSLPRTSNTPGAFNHQQYLKSQHISAVLYRTQIIHTLDTKPPTPQTALLKTVEQTQQRIVDVFEKALGSPEGDVVGGIVLGHKAIPIDADIKQTFINTGLIHFLAASGLNVGIIAGFILLILREFPVSYRLKLLIAMLGVLVYSCLAGLSPSILRAGTMLELALLLKIINRELSALFLLCAAVTLILLAFPDTISNLGFQFSVLTTFGIITMVPPLHNWLGYYMTRWLSGLILVPLIAQIWILPISLYHFNNLPIHSIPLNILTLTLVTPLTAIGFTAGALALVWEPLGHYVSLLAWPFIKLLLLLVNVGDQMTWAQWAIGSPSPWVILTSYILLLTGVLFLGPMAKLPALQKARIALFLVFIAFAPIGVEKFLGSSETRVDIIPLNRQKVALALQPENSDQLLLVLPQKIGYWQGHTINDYLRNRSSMKLQAIFLPDQEPPLSEGLSEILEKHPPQEIYRLDRMKPEESFYFGNLKITRKNGQKIQLLSNNTCLIESNLNSDTTHQQCRLTLLQPSQGKYFFSGLDSGQTLENNHFYRLLFSHNGQNATVKIF